MPVVNFNVFGNKDGNVGISNNAPTNKLHVTGTSFFGGATSFLTGTWHLSSEGKNRFFYGANSRTYYGSGDGTYEYRSSTDASILYFSNSGNIGINLFPTNALTVAKPAGTAADISLRANNNAAAAELLIAQDLNGLDSYVYNRANGPLFFGTNNLERMRITAAGNIGIGTTNPAYPGIHVNTPTGQSFIHFTRDAQGNTGTDGVTVGLGSDTNAYVNNRENTALIFGTNNAERMRINAGGFVGIGTSTTNYLLDAYNAAAGDASLRFKASSGGSELILDSTNNYSAVRHFNSGTEYWRTGMVGGTSTWHVYDYANSATRLIVANTGNVGIGTNSPRAKLEVAGDIWTDWGDRFIGTVFDVGTTYRLGFKTVANTRDTQIWSQSNDGSGISGITFYTGSTPSERMRINSAGRLLLGTTTISDGNSARFTLLGTFPETPIEVRQNSANSYYVMTFRNPNGLVGAIRTFGNDLAFDQIIASGNMLFSTINTERMRIANTGNVGINTSSPTSRLSVTGETSLGQGHKLTFIGLDINSGGTPNFIKIKTNIPTASASADFTVNIKGFRYSDGSMCDLTIGWHYYLSTFYNVSASSSGSFAPTVRLSSENNLVCIVLTAPGYWPKLYVESMYSSAYNDEYATGWTWVDEDATGNPLVTVPYKSNFGNQFVMTTAGDVGINTTGPAAKLDVNGAVIARGTTSILGGNALDIYNNLGNNYTRQSVDASNNYFIRTINAHDIIHGTSGTERMRLAANGNLGIGTSVPSQKLSVAGNAIIGTEGNTRLMLFGVGGGQTIREHYDLEVNPRWAVGRDFISGGQAGIGFVAVANGAFANVGVAVGTPSSSILSFYTSNTTALAERVRITGSGNVGIGNTAPTNTLSVNGTSFFSNNVIFNGNIVAGANYNKKVVFVDNNASASNVTYELCRISRDSVNWSSQFLTITVYNRYYRGGKTVWNIVFNQVNAGTVTCSESFGTFMHKVYLGDEVIVSGTIGYRPVFIDMPAYTTAEVEVTHGYVETTSTPSASGRLQFTGTSSANASAVAYGGDIQLVPSGGNVGVGLTPVYKLDVAGGVRAQALRTWNHGSNADHDALTISSSGVSSVIKSFGDETGLILRSEVGNIILADDRGNVGIGTTTPGVKLDINGNARIANGSSLYWFNHNSTTNGPSITGNSDALNIESGPVGPARGSLNLIGHNNSSLQTDNGYLTLSASQAGTSEAHIRFNTASVERMRIANNGNIGIGITSPSSLLDVYGARQSATIKVVSNFFDTQATNVDVGGGVGFGGKFDATNYAHYASVGGRKENNTSGNYAGYLVLETRPNGNELTERMRISSGGNFGINTTTPQSIFHINANTAGTIESLRLQGRYSTIGDGTFIRFTNYHANGLVPNALEYNLAGIRGYDYDNNWGGGLDFQTATGGTAGGAALTTKMTIAANGNVGVGTTAPNGADGKALAIYGASVARLALKTGDTGDASGDGFQLAVSGGAAYIEQRENNLMAISTNNTERIRITAGGNVGIGATDPQSILDVITPNSGYASFARALNVGGWTGIHFGYREGNALYRKSAIVFERTDNSGGGGNAAGKVHILNGPAAGSGSATLADSRLTIDELGKVGIATTAPVTRLHVGAEVTDDNGFAYDTNTLYVVHQTASNTTVLNDPKPVLMLARQGTGGQAFGSAVEFNLCRYENAGGSNVGSRSRLDIRMAHDAFMVANTTVMTLRSDGAVGIGTTAPNTTFHVQGTALFRNTGAAVTLDSGSATDARMEFKYNNVRTGYIAINSSYFVVAANSAANLALGANATEHMRIITTGDVGIGTTAPYARLNVLKDATYNNESAATIAITSSETSNTVSMVLGADNTNGISYIQGVRRGASWVQNIALNPINGNVGVGTITPGSKLTISGNIRHVTSATDGTTGFELFDASTGGSHIGSITRRSNGIGIASYDFIAMYTNATGGISGGTEKLRITSAGNIGIGVTNPLAKVHVALTGASTAAITTVSSFGTNGIFSLGSIANNSEGVYLGTGYNDTGVNGGIAAGLGFFREASGWNTALTFYTNGTTDSVTTNRITERMRIISNGNVGIGTTNPGYKLEVVGSFAATTKSFVIDHPTKPNYKLRYGSLESPYHGIRLTGEAEVIDGICTVKLPDYIHALCKSEGVNIQLTNIKHGKVLWVDEINIDNNEFTVATETNGNYKFYWSFTAVRKDIEDMIVEFENNEKE